VTSRRFNARSFVAAAPGVAFAMASIGPSKQSEQGDKRFSAKPEGTLKPDVPSNCLPCYSLSQPDRGT
jgi:hypothetical protein